MSSPWTPGSLPSKKNTYSRSDTLSRLDAGIVTAETVSTTNLTVNNIGPNPDGGDIIFNNDIDINNNNILNVNNIELVTINNISGDTVTFGGDIDVDNNNILNVNDLDVTTINNGGDITSFGGQINMNNNRIINLADPINPQDATTKNYVDNQLDIVTWKQAVRLATLSDLNATYNPGTLEYTANVNGALTLDNVAANNGDRILVKNQTDATENGIVVVTDAGSAGTPFVLERADDFNVSAEVLAGSSVFVQEGDTLQETGWLISSDDPHTLDTDDVDWLEFTRTSLIAAGDGLVKTATAVNVVGTADRIIVFPNSVDIAPTYAGQSSIDTVGTITTGTWEGTDVGIAHGGTSASTAAQARFNLGLQIGVDIQAWDAALQSIANLVTAANQMIYTTAADTYAVTTLTPFARSLLDDSNASTARVTLGLQIGVDVQAWDAALQSIANLVTAADQMIYTTAADTYAVTALTPFARSLLDDPNASTARVTLGLGSIAVQNVNYLFPTPDGAAGQILQTDGAGTLSFVNNTGASLTGANVGAGTGLIFRDKTGSTLNFKSLVQGVGIVLLNGADDITIATPAEVNAAANLASGIPIDGAGGIAEPFEGKTGAVLNFKTLRPGFGINISDVTGTDISFTSLLFSQIYLNTLVSTGAGSDQLLGSFIHPNVTGNRGRWLSALINIHITAGSGSGTWRVRVHRRLNNAIVGETAIFNEAAVVNDTTVLTLNNLNNVDSFMPGEVAELRLVRLTGSTVFSLRAESVTVHW